MKKPHLQLLKDYKVEVSSDTVFMSNARLLQAIWKEEMFPEISHIPVYKGNYLPFKFAKKRKANFLTKRIGKLVEYNVNNSKGLIKEPRIWDNLLSSQPLAFNLFGELSSGDGLNVATLVFRKLINKNINEVIEIKFEYSPKRSDIKYTNDRTAFDVFIKYITNEGKRGFIGIEVKYSEHLYNRPDKEELDNKVKTVSRYKQIAKESGLFKDESMYQLLYTNIHQLWRDHLLALSMFISNNDYDIGDYVILYPKDNYQCANTISKYKNSFQQETGKSFFSALTLEDLVDSLKTCSNEKWIDNFIDRYLNFEKLN